MSKKFWSFKSFGKQKQPEIKVDKDELKKKLTPIQYRVTQDKVTERPFSGEYLKLKDNGMYACIVCDQELFSSTCKYDSGCGWPAFYDAENPEKLILKPDLSHVGSNLILLAIKPDLVRTEVTCGKCGAHLGHVFDDGPKPTGLRYCINSAALKFNPASNGPADLSSCSTSTCTSGDRIPSCNGQDEKCCPNNSVTNQNNTLKTASTNAITTATTGSMASESTTIASSQSKQHNKLQGKLGLPTQTNGNLTITPKGNITSSTTLASTSNSNSNSNCNCKSTSASTFTASRQPSYPIEPQQQQLQSTHMQINLPVNHSMTPAALNSTTELKVNQSPSNLRQKLRMEFYYGTSA